MDTNEQIKHIRTQHDMTQNEFAAHLWESAEALTQTGRQGIASFDLF